MKTNASDVAIIGGGVAGCAAAYYLAKAGVRSTIIEREGVASQASGYSAGELTLLQGFGISMPMGPLATESFRMQVELFDLLSEESGVDFHPRIVSSIKVAFDESELSELQESLNVFQAAGGFSGYWLEVEDVLHVEPRLSPEIIRAVCLYGNAVLDSYLYTLALFKVAESMGARLRAATAIGLKPLRGRVAGVLLDDGELDCESVVIASGPWARDAERWLDVPIPVEPVKGEIPARVASRPRVAARI